MGYAPNPRRLQLTWECSRWLRAVSASGSLLLYPGASPHRYDFVCVVRHITKGCMSTSLISTDTLAQAQAALAADPTNASLHAELGMAYFYLDRYNEAFAAFQQALALNPDDVVAHNGVGRVYYHLGPPEAAIAAYTRAITIDPQFVPGYWGLGILYFAQLGLYDQALAIFQQGLERNPQEVGFYDGIGQTYARAGHFDQAIATYNMVAELVPTDPSADVNLSIINLHLGQYSAALAAMQHAIILAPEHAWQYRVLGFIHDRMESAEQAVIELERAVSLDPSDYEAHGGLARAYRVVGRSVAAQESEARGRPLAEQEDEYAQACFESVIGNLDAAVDLLEIALARKQLTAGWARIDPEFVFLQDHPRYQALLDLYSEVTREK